MNSARRARKGFTLIEMLVVVSIIGLLSSIILAALGNARQSSSIGNAKEFASYNYHYIGINALAIYNFDEGSGYTAHDSSINSYDATLFQNTSSHCTSLCWAASTSTVSGNGSAFVASNAGDQYGYRSLTNALPTNQMTVSVWVYPTNMSANGVIAAVEDSSGDANILLSNTNSGALHAQSMASGWTNSASSCSLNSTGALKSNTWQNITLSVNGSNGTLYLNGNQIGTLTGCTGMTPTPLTPSLITIGDNDNGGDIVFTGSIDDLYIYTQSLSLNQVQKLYALGAPKHGLAVE